MITPNHQPSFASKSLLRIRRALKVTFWSGPRLLFTSRLSLRSAVFMIAASIPALVCTTAMTIPALVYSTPESNTYFYFGRILQGDPVSWVPMTFAAICSFLAFAVPSERPALAFLRSA